MEQLDYITLAEKVRRMGQWAGVRWLRNQGIGFVDAHLVIFGCYPRWLT
jgi:hypothetical protein